MIEIKTHQIPSSIKSFFDSRDPAGFRCIAVLEGIRPGRIFSDSDKDPTWVMVWESAFGAIYPGGNVSASVFNQLIHRFRKEKAVCLCLFPDDSRWHMIQLKHDYEGLVLDFYDRIQDGRLGKFLNKLPEGIDFHLVNKQLIERSVNRDLHLLGYPNPEKAVKDLSGFFLMKDDEILCEALAGAEVMGTREIGIDTPAPYRRRGYGTITCSKLIQHCEQQGLKTYWNCNKENPASVALARKLGYQTKKEYRLLIWNMKTRERRGDEVGDLDL